MAGFDVQAARQSGYSDDEILQHLTQSRNFDVDGAVKAGYSKQDIINHLSGASAPSQPTLTNQFRPSFAEGVSGAAIGVDSPESLTAAQARPTAGDWIATAMGAKPLQMAAGMVKDYGQNLYQRGKTAMQDAYDAGQNIGNGQPVGQNIGKAALGGYQALNAAVPLVGEQANKVGEDVAKKNYGSAFGRGLTTLTLAAVAGKKAGLETPDMPSLPSLERAGGNFQDVMGAAKNKPVPMTDELSGALSRYQELVDRGGSRSLSVSKLLNRVTNPDAPPITYGEARDFASNISRLSADESMRLTPQMKQQIGAIRVALNNAVGQAAESVGKGAQYQSAMKEYSKAAQLNKLVDDAVDYGKKAIPYAGAAYGLKKLSDALGK